MDKRRFDNLLVQVAKGSEDAFEKLYYETYKGIYALIYPYFHNSLDTEDALQEVYIRVKDKAHLYKKGTDARAWLFQLAKNTTINLLRDKYKGRDVTSNIGDEEYASKDSSWDNTMFILMQKCLDDDEYQIVIRYILMKYKHKEIASELNMPLGTVLYKYQVALEKIRKELK